MAVMCPQAKNTKAWQQPPEARERPGLGVGASRRESSLREPWSQTAGLQDCESECLFF